MNEWSDIGIDENKIRAVPDVITFDEDVVDKTEYDVDDSPGIRYDDGSMVNSDSETSERLFDGKSLDTESLERLPDGKSLDIEVVNDMLVGGVNKLKVGFESDSDNFDDGDNVDIRSDDQVRASIFEVLSGEYEREDALDKKSLTVVFDCGSNGEDCFSKFDDN